MREKAERLERERNDAVRFAEEIKAQYAKKSEPVDEDIHINDEDLVEGKHLSKVAKKISHLENQIREYEKRNQESSIEVKIRQQYPDFEKIVSADNIAALKEADPDLAEAIHHTPDLFKKASLAYKMIKKMGISHQEDLYEKERVVAQKNAGKPRSMNTISPQQGDSPLSNANAFANGLTDDLKARLRKEMEEARKAAY